MKEEKTKVRRQYVPFWNNGGRCFEAVTMKGRDFFLTYDGSQFKTVEALELSETLEAKPAQYSPNPYSFEALPTGFKCLPALYFTTYGFWTDYFAHPDPRVIKFLALADVYTYAAVKGPGCLQVFLVGGKRSGKTTTQILAEKTGYRAFGGVDPSEPAIYRTLGYETEYAPLVIVREYEKASDTMKLISRESDIPGATVPRADKVDDRFEVHYYYTYGPRLCGANKLPDGFTEADNDRLHVIKAVHMRPKRARAELYRNREVMDRLKALRNDLLLWRIASYKNLEIPVEDPKAKISEGRDWEHYGGIVTLAALISPQLEAEMRDYIDEVLGEAVEDSKASIESSLAEVIINLSKDKSNNTLDGVRLPFNIIWDGLRDTCTSFYENGLPVPTKLISPDGRVVTTTSIGKMLKENLFGKRTKPWWDAKGEKTVRGYIWAKESLTTLTGLTSITGSGEEEKHQESLEQHNETPAGGGAGIPVNAPETGNAGNTCNEEASS